jgi:hypothetical protein
MSASSARVPGQRVALPAIQSRAKWILEVAMMDEVGGVGNMVDGSRVG